MKDCTNEKVKPICILCGNNTHDSFDCDAKMCFRCNKVGHVVSACKEENLISCLKCGLNGHSE